MDWSTFLRISHVIATVLGAGGATFAEIISRSSLRDGQVDPSEGRLLALVYRTMRVGLVLLVLSGFGFFLLYRIEGHEERLYNPRFWAKVMITIVLVVNAFLLQVRKIPFWAGAAISLISWYAALVLGIWRSLRASFWEMMFWYVIVVLITMFILRAIHRGAKSSI